VVTVVDDKIEKVVIIVFGGLNPYIWDTEDCFHMSLELTTVGADLRTFAKGSLRLQ